MAARAAAAAAALRAGTTRRRRSRADTLRRVFTGRTILLPACSFLILLGLWQLSVSLPTTRRIPGPLAVLQAMRTIDPALYGLEAVRSLLRVLAGFVIAAAVGIPLGIMIGSSRWIRELTFPAIEFLRPIPPIAWIPLSVLFFTRIESQIVFLTFYGAFFPILYNTMGGVASVDPAFVRAARSLGANSRQVFHRIVFPAALPSIFTGLTIAMGVTWLMVIAAEMIASRGGLGYLTWEAYTTLNYPLIFVGMGMIGIVGALSSVAIRLFGRRLMRWQRRF
jgi:NitT/TauT family transport system permease protein